MGFVQLARFIEDFLLVAALDNLDDHQREQDEIECRFRHRLYRETEEGEMGDVAAL